MMCARIIVLTIPTHKPKHIFLLLFWCQRFREPNLHASPRRTGSSRLPAETKGQKSEKAMKDDVDPLVGFNPLDLFCSSHDALRGHNIDQLIPANLGWTSGVGNAAAAAVSSPKSRGDMQVLCRRGIPPSLRCAIWIINVVSAANPNMSQRECDEFGTLRKMRVVGKRDTNLH